MLSYARSLAAASEILKGNISAMDTGMAIVVVLTSIIAVPLHCRRLAAPERSAQRLAAWTAWLLRNAQAVVLVVLMVVRGFPIVKASRT